MCIMSLGNYGHVLAEELSALGHEVKVHFKKIVIDNVIFQ